MREEHFNKQNALVDSFTYNSTRNPIADKLQTRDWLVIGTLTFAGRYYQADLISAQGLRVMEFNRLLECAAGHYKFRVRHLSYYWKVEWGSSKQAHFNFLIGRKGIEFLCPFALSATLQNMWYSGTHRQGRAQVEPFNKDLLFEGVDYQSKIEFDKGGQRIEPIEYCSRPLRKEMLKMNGIFCK